MKRFSLQSVGEMRHGETDIGEQWVVGNRISGAIRRREPDIGKHAAEEKLMRDRCAKSGIPVNYRTMRLRNIPEAKEIVANSPYVIHDAAAMKGHWRDLSEKPLYIEIGTGKGRFIIETAEAHPECEYIGIERYESVLFRACEKMDGIPYSTPADRMEQQMARKRREEETKPGAGHSVTERAEDPEREIEAGKNEPGRERGIAGNADLSGTFNPPGNLHFLCEDAEHLTSFFGNGEVSGIFLNFSDPWPKKRHAKRRLTSRHFLALYEQVLKDGGVLEFKTDNQDLFTFSLEEFREAGHWEVTGSTRDLHRDPEMCAGNIMTEYERKFSELGNPICKLTAVFHETI